MNRRDMIIIATLLNGAILALLFVLASNRDESSSVSAPSESIVFSNQQVADIPLVKEAVEPQTSAKEVFVQDLEHDFAEYTLPSSDLIFNEDIALYSDIAAPERDSVAPEVVEISIKSGDFLEKIARANGTTVEAIKQLNDLKTERLRIGQILKVPVGTVTHTKAEAAKSVALSAPRATAPTHSSTDAEAVYYTIKGGDNPWKIAKQFKVRTEDLLKLNGLNEEKARNLKAGDRIRIK